MGKRSLIGAIVAVSILTGAAMVPSAAAESAIAKSLPFEVLADDGTPIRGNV